MTLPDNSPYDLTMTSGSTTISLVMCDANGNRNPLAFSRNPVRRSSLKMYTSEQKYSDLEPPWTPIAQTDWSGGKGSKDFDKAADMYFDGYQVNTLRPGEIILGPKPTTVSFGSYAAMSNTETTSGIDFEMLSVRDYYWAFPITASETIAVKDITLDINFESGAGGTLYLGLAAVSGGNPSGATWTTTGVSTTTGGFGNNPFKFKFSSAYNLVNGTSYFLLMKVTGLTGVGYFTVRESTTTGVTVKTSSDGSTWSNVAYYPYSNPYFLMTNGGSIKNKAHLFEYKGALYYAMQNDDASGTKLYLNGDHGLAKTGATTSVVTIKGKAGWAANQAAGCILKIVSGTGTNQPQPWRVIASNSATSSNETELILVDEFDVAPAENDVLAIVASNKFTELNDFDTAYDVVVTDVLSVNGVVYFACGDSEAIKRMVAFNNSGTWIYHWSGYTSGQDAETGMYTYLAYASDQSGTYIWGAKGGYPATIAKATAVDYTGYTGTETLLSFGSAINVGNLYERITGLEVYGEFGSLHILKEGSFYELYDDKPREISIREMRSTVDSRNGKAHCVMGVYLYFSWHNTLMRYYNGILDRVGPDKAEVAIPTGNRHGYFSALAPYAGQLLAAVDAGIDGVSSVLAYNDTGWCELYRGTLGERIQNLYIQSIPGNAVDRLWIAEGNNIIWLPLSIDPYNHPSDDYNPYEFVTEGTLISSWYYVRLQELEKLYNSLKLVIENASATYFVTAKYQTDDDSSWTDITGTFDTFSKELELATTPSVTGRRLRFMLTLSGDGSGTPRVLATVLDTITRLPNKYVTTVTCRLDPKDIDAYSATGALTKFNALTAFQNLSTPVTVDSKVDMLSGVSAFVDGLTPRPYKSMNDLGDYSYIVQFDLIEI